MSEMVEKAIKILEKLYQGKFVPRSKLDRSLKALQTLKKSYEVYENPVWKSSDAEEILLKQFDVHEFTPEGRKGLEKYKNFLKNRIFKAKSRYLFAGDIARLFSGEFTFEELDEKLNEMYPQGIAPYRLDPILGLRDLTKKYGVLETRASPKHFGRLIYRMKPELREKLLSSER